MPQCQGFKTNGERCRRADDGLMDDRAPHLRFCGIHWGVYERRVAIRRQLTTVVTEQHHRVGTCHKWVGNHRWCGRECQGDALLCDRHGAVVAAREAERQAAAELARQRIQRNREVEQFYRNHVPAMTWRQVMDHMFVHRRLDMGPGDVYEVSFRYFLHPIALEPDFTHQWQFRRHWQWNINGRVGEPPNLRIHPVEVPPLHMPPPPPPDNLAMIARDRQNVHTAVVSQQTNKGLEKLLEEAKHAATLRSPEWFAARWLLKSYGHWDNVVRTVNDMIRWYDTRTCRTHNDWLYKKTLDGLYITIRKLESSDTKQELFQRVYEECYESIGMCCDGHISRLCNVLVGFDDEFAPPVPFGEILQNKMAAIAGLDVETDEKIRQATAFFNEFAVPEADRAAWLEAF
jgi:hypothetical protein